MSRVRQVSLTRTGKPELDGALDVTQRGFDQLGADVTSMGSSSQSFVAKASHWVAPAPTTKDAAIARMASALFTLLAGPIP